MMLPSAFPLVAAALTVPSLHGYGSACPVLPARLVQMAATSSDSKGICAQRVAVYFGKLSRSAEQQRLRAKSSARRRTWRSVGACAVSCCCLR